jgi:hypothetical protein
MYTATQRLHQQTDEVKAFLAEILEVCKRHELSLSHEDVGGAFRVHQWNVRDNNWVAMAGDDAFEIEPSERVVEVENSFEGLKTVYPSVLPEE